MQFVDLNTQYRRIEADVKRRINAVLEHGRFIMGPEVIELEEKLAAYTGAKHALAVANGSDALLLALLALDIQAGDEIITTPFSFIATAEMISLLGARPVFVDIDAATYNLDPGNIEAAITKRSKAILPVSLFGQCADFDAINDIAQRYGLPVVEDAAQSFGATYKNRSSCALSSLATTSFYPSKPLGCYGEGGACFTDSDELAKTLRELRNHGQDHHYHHPRIGINGRLDSLQAAVLLAKMTILNEELDARVGIAARYDAMLNAIVQRPFIASYNRSTYAQYTLEVDDRSSVQQALHDRGIPTAVHYPVPLHLQPAFAYLGYTQGSFPIAESAAERVISLPMHPYLDEPTLQTICTAVAECVTPRVQPALA